MTYAALALQLVVRATGQRLPRSPRILGQFLVMGVLNNLIPFSLIFWGQTQIGSGLVSILNATTPLWTVLLAHWLTKDERLTTNKLVGVLVGLVGAAVVIGLDALDGEGSNVLARAGATNVLLVTLLIPASALLLAAAVLGEALDLRHLLGMALIGLGLLVMDGRLFTACHTLAQSRQDRV